MLISALSAYSIFVPEIPLSLYQFGLLFTNKKQTFGKKIISSPAGFEPAPSRRIRLAGARLNRSTKVTVTNENLIRSDEILTWNQSLETVLHPPASVVLQFLSDQSRARSYEGDMPMAHDKLE